MPALQIRDKQIVPIKKEQPQLAIAGPEADRDKPAASKKRISGARLLKRVFNIDISICPKCRGQIRIIAAIEDPKVIKKILEHMDLPSTAPRPMSARGPPVSDQSDIFAQQFFEE